MKDIYKTSAIVKDCLEEKPETRNSDTELYVEVCSRINPMVCNMNFAEVMRNRRELGLPNTETVRRARQKIQETNEELRAVKAVDDERYENWKEVRHYVATA